MKLKVVQSWSIINFNTLVSASWREIKNDCSYTGILDLRKFWKHIGAGEKE